LISPELRMTLLSPADMPVTPKFPAWLLIVPRLLTRLASLTEIATEPLSWTVALGPTRTMSGSTPGSA